METKALEAMLRKSGSRMVLGGFRSSESPRASWFGRVRLARPDEAWPFHQGQPMLPLCQLNLAEAPLAPSSLGDLALITVFVSAVRLPVDAENGDGWQLRAYPSLERLIEIDSPQHDNPIRSFPIRWEPLEADYPSREDVPLELPDGIADDTYELVEHHPVSKIGGWPYLVQSEICWAPHNRHPANPEYVFQIASEPKAHWQWGDGGIGYFGRGTGDARAVWTLSWQCY
jgi:uncharacterized protein YwqG